MSAGTEPAEKAKPTPKRRARRRTPAASANPDIIGKKGRARALLETLAEMQGSAARTQAMMIANGQEESDLCPGAQVEKEDQPGTFRPMTYKERLAQFAEAEARLWEYADTLELRAELESMVKEVGGES